MSLFREATHRDTILFVNGIRHSTIEAIDTYRTRYGKEVNILIVIDATKKDKIKAAEQFSKLKRVTIITVNVDEPIKLKRALAPYVDRLLAFSSQFEDSIPTLQKLQPFLPYLNGPTKDSLDWATDKIKMRRLLKAHDPAISPLYTVVRDATQESIETVEKNVGYPCVVKPAGLAASLLVTIVYHREELEEALKAVFKRLNKVYAERHGRGTPQVLVEQLMEGEMYSIDGYVNDRGNIYLTPPVHVKTGRAIGFDDFFGYQRLTPTKLTKPKIEDANKVAVKSIKALGLRSTSCHIELMKTATAWKVIELAPRMGGFRHTMYSWSYGINHILNDILIRIPQKPVIPKKHKGYTAVFNMYARKEGTLESVSGIRKVRSLTSFVNLTQRKNKGDQLLFAKNGGKPVMEIVLFNKTRSDLLADIRRMEKAIDIVVKPKGKRKRATAQ